MWSSDYLPRVDHFSPLSGLDNTPQKTFFKGNLYLELTPSWHFDVFSLGAECQYWCNIRVLALLVLQLNAFSHTAAGWLVHLQLQGHIVSSRTYQMLATYRAVSLSSAFFVFSALSLLQMTCMFKWLSQFPVIEYEMTLCTNIIRVRKRGIEGEWERSLMLSFTPA